MIDPMPALFFGHGNPMNALSRNAYTDGWASVGKSIPHPKTILAISAHWYVPDLLVTANDLPPTIHDFGGFPPELYQVEYPAPGSPGLAQQVKDLLAPLSVGLDHKWGLDHGTWAVLCHLFPEANVPVVQLSIDERQPPQFHYELGKRLAPLRAEGVLIVGSGNIVHNLRRYAWGKSKVEPFDWAVRFENQVKELLLKNDEIPLINYKKSGEDAMLSVPTPEHYLPLLYVAGTRAANDQVSFPIEGVDGGSISMLAVKIG